jgi:hypothetical protein
VIDAFLPGWETVYNNPGIWHFRFNGPTPEALVQGREQTYFEHFWNDFAADKTHSIPEADREAYTEAYAKPGRMRAGWAYFVSFQQAARDFAQLSQTKRTIPVQSIGGEKANGDVLAHQMKLVASDVTFVVLKDSRLGDGRTAEGDNRPGEVSLRPSTGISLPALGFPLPGRLRRSLPALRMHSSTRLRCAERRPLGAGGEPAPTAGT